MEEGKPYFTHHEQASRGGVLQSSLLLMKAPAKAADRQDREDFGHCPSDIEGDYVYPEPPSGEGNWPGYWSIPNGRREVVGGGGSVGSFLGREVQLDMVPRYTQPAGSYNQTPGTVFSHYTPVHPPVPQRSSGASPLPTRTVYRTTAPAPLPGRRFYGPPPQDPIAAPPAPSTTALSNPPGPEVGHPLPASLLSLVTEIKSKARHDGLRVPPRRDLMNTSALIREHFRSASGILRPESELREWYGDLRIFPVEWWEYLSAARPRFEG